jgi:hypothetical protein
VPGDAVEESSVTGPTDVQERPVALALITEMEDEEELTVEAVDRLGGGIISTWMPMPCCSMYGVRCGPGSETRTRTWQPFWAFAASSPGRPETARGCLSVVPRRSMCSIASRIICFQSGASSALKEL